MICPYCQKEMQSGYIQCRDGIHWTPKKQLIAALSGFGKGGISLGKAVIAYRCKHCKTVMISYKE